jgi:hypothetical protein
MQPASVHRELEIHLPRIEKFLEKFVNKLDALGDLIM